MLLYRNCSDHHQYLLALWQGTAMPIGAVGMFMAALTPACIYHHFYSWYSILVILLFSCQLFLLLTSNQYVLTNHGFKCCTYAAFHLNEASAAT